MVVKRGRGPFINPPNYLGCTTSESGDSATPPPVSHTVDPSPPCNTEDTQPQSPPGVPAAPHPGNSEVQGSGGSVSSDSSPARAPEAPNSIPPPAEAVEGLPASETPNESLQAPITEGGVGENWDSHRLAAVPDGSTPTPSKTAARPPPAECPTHGFPAAAGEDLGLLACPISTEATSTIQNQGGHSTPSASPVSAVAGSSPAAGQGNLSEGGGRMAGESGTAGPAGGRSSSTSSPKAFPISFTSIPTTSRSSNKCTADGKIGAQRREGGTLPISYFLSLNAAIAVCDNSVFTCKTRTCCS